MSSEVRIFKSEAAWKAARNGWVGASEVSTLLQIGVTKKDTPEALAEKVEELLARKRGTGPEIEQTLGMRLGLFLEPFLLREYLALNPDRDGYLATVERDTQTVHVHASGFLAATPDAWIWERSNPEVRWTLQLKAYSEFMRSKCAGGCPPHLEAQVAAEALCCDTPRASWFIMCGNALPCYFGDVERDAEAEANVLAVAEAFMCRVKEGQEVVS